MLIEHRYVKAEIYGRSTLDGEGSGKTYCERMILALSRLIRKSCGSMLMTAQTQIVDIKLPFPLT